MLQGMCLPLLSALARTTKASMSGNQPGHADTRGAAEERHRATRSNVAVGRILSRRAVYSKNENKMKVTGKWRRRYIQEKQSQC